MVANLVPEWCPAYRSALIVFKAARLLKGVQHIMLLVCSISNETENLCARMVSGTSGC